MTTTCKAVLTIRMIVSNLACRPFDKKSRYHQALNQIEEVYFPLQQNESQQTRTLCY